LNKVANRREWPAGTELIKNAEEIHTYSSVISGVVKLTKTMTDGREQIVGLQFSPDFLGRPFQDESKVCAEAATRVSLCTFPKSTIDKLLESSTALKQLLLEQALLELDEAREWMLALGRKTASEKVAGFIHMIACHIDPETEPQANKISFDLPLSRADIADFLGLTVETVSRQLTKLRKAGVVEIDRNRHFVIPDITRLEHFSGL
jgi:CRP/FNR family transcriptional regulator